MRLASAFALFAAFAFILYGWGWALRRLLSVESNAGTRSWPATAASGMAVVVFLGGVLNLARLAFPWALAVVAIAGAALGALALKKDRGRPEPTPWIAWLLASAVLCFVTLTQLPPKAYNFHDDYQKYFVHPVRMLETGSVFGSPLSDIGFDTIGGQAFVDGFVVAAFPIRYINGVGAAFALFLCMMLASQFTRGRRELIPLTIVCALSVVFINPQYVNISALYTGSLLMMALFEAVSEENGSSPAVTGLLYAALLALKSTFALFVVLHFAATPFICGWKWTRRAALACALFISPWILLHAPHYASIFHASAEAPETGVRPQETFDMFSTEALDYGATPANYTGLMLAIGLSGLMIAWSRRKVDMTAASCFAAVAAYFIMIYVSGPRNAGYAQAVRYFTPFAIGAAPAAFGSAGLALLEAPKLRTGHDWKQFLRLGLPLLVASVPVLAFAPSLRDRVRQALDSGSVLAFSWLAPTPDYLEYNRQVLYGDMRQRVAAAQAAVPPGEAAVVWMNAPFYLDFRRNRIADVEPGAGLITPWSKMPEAHYFIFEYGGYATVDPDDYREEMAEGPDMMRRVGAARLNMTERMDAMMQRGQKLFDDGRIAVFRE
jgi:hypothetical protein